jgi:uncharacterized protein YqgV (UPF0045/DUF77 family)
VKVTVDVSLYPLQEEFVPVIIDFIHRVERREGIEIERNNLSTQLFGEYERVMAVLAEELRHSWETHGKAVLVAKFAPGDVRRSH